MKEERVKFEVLNPKKKVVRIRGQFACRTVLYGEIEEVKEGLENVMKELGRIVILPGKVDLIAHFYNWGLLRKAYDYSNK